MNIQSINTRWDLVVPGNKDQTITYSTEHFIRCYQEAIKSHDSFSVALSGGSTPKAIFEKITASPYKEHINWAKIFLFWSDERSVPADHPDSNYHMAMSAGFEKMKIPKDHIFRMQAESHIEDHALNYEKLLHHHLKKHPFDLIMLGMGDDGHTASLFPGTDGLKEHDRLIIANHIPEKSTWRMTMTFKLINHARHRAIYVMGSSKRDILKKVLSSESTNPSYPITFVGTPSHKTLWIIDQEAGYLL